MPDPCAPGPAAFRSATLVGCDPIICTRSSRRATAEIVPSTRANGNGSKTRYNRARMDFEIVGDLAAVETIAAGKGIRELPRLRRLYGKGRWRKMKGVARIRLRDGRVRRAELHWYEAHGIGKKEFKRKRFLD